MYYRPNDQPTTNSHQTRRTTKHEQTATPQSKPPAKQTNNQTHTPTTKQQTNQPTTERTNRPPSHQPTKRRATQTNTKQERTSKAWRGLPLSVGLLDLIASTLNVCCPSLEDPVAYSRPLKIGSRVKRVSHTIQTSEQASKQRTAKPRSKSYAAAAVGTVLQTHRQHPSVTADQATEDGCGWLPLPIPALGGKIEGKSG
jgi:hypothetical protein